MGILHPFCLHCIIFHDSRSPCIRCACSYHFILYSPTFSLMLYEPTSHLICTHPSLSALVTLNTYLRNLTSVTVDGSYLLLSSSMIRYHTDILVQPMFYKPQVWFLFLYCFSVCVILSHTYRYISLFYRWYLLHHNKARIKLPRNFNAGTCSITSLFRTSFDQTGVPSFLPYMPLISFSFLDI
jgi:hypothetical protein